VKLWQNNFEQIPIITNRAMNKVLPEPHGPSSSSYSILQHNIKQIKIITVEYNNTSEGCQRSKGSLNWPPILYNYINTNDKRKK